MKTILPFDLLLLLRPQGGVGVLFTIISNKYTTTFIGTSLIFEYGIYTPVSVLVLGNLLLCPCFMFTHDRNLFTFPRSSSHHPSFHPFPLTPSLFIYLSTTFLLSQGLPTTDKRVPLYFVSVDDSPPLILQTPFPFSVKLSVRSPYIIPLAVGVN